jgi:hypothetical protein
MVAARNAGKLAKGGGPGRGKKGKKPGPRATRFLSLKDQGVDKHLADRARKAAAMPKAKFEVQVARAVKIAVAAAEDDKAVISAARAEPKERL